MKKTLQESDYLSQTFCFISALSLTFIKRASQAKGARGAQAIMWTKMNFCLRLGPNCSHSSVNPVLGITDRHENEMNV